MPFFANSSQRISRVLLTLHIFVALDAAAAALSLRDVLDAAADAQVALVVVANFAEERFAVSLLYGLVVFLFNLLLCQALYFVRAERSAKLDGIVLTRL